MAGGETAGREDKEVGESRGPVESTGVLWRGRGKEVVGPETPEVASGGGQPHHFMRRSVALRKAGGVRAPGRLGCGAAAPNRHPQRGNRFVLLGLEARSPRPQFFRAATPRAKGASAPACRAAGPGAAGVHAHVGHIPGPGASVLPVSRSSEPPGQTSHTLRPGDREVAGGRALGAWWCAGPSEGSRLAVVRAPRGQGRLGPAAAQLLVT